MIDSSRPLRPATRPWCRGSVSRAPILTGGGRDPPAARCRHPCVGSDPFEPGRAAAGGKSDPLDAITATKVALAGADLPAPMTSDGPVESIRVLSMTRDSASGPCQRAPADQDDHGVRTGRAARSPAPVDRSSIAGQAPPARPGTSNRDVEAATLVALRRLADGHA